MRRLSLALGVIVVTVAGFAIAPAAHALAPDNDTFLTATPVGVGFTEVVDASEATHDADDNAIADACLNEQFPLPPPADFSKSIWYSFSPGDPGTYSIDTTFEASFPVAFVATGSPGTFDCVASGAGEVIFDAVGGQTYSVAVIDLDPTGFPLSVKFGAAVPFVLAMTVDGTGGFFIDGQALIRGTYSCNSPLQTLLLNVLVKQPVGNTSIDSFHTFSVADPLCDGLLHPWSTIAEPVNGKYRGGHADVTADVDECAPRTCNEDHVVHQDVHLSREGTAGPTPPVIQPQPDPLLPPLTIPLTNDSASNPYNLTANQPVILDTAAATSQPADVLQKNTCLWGLNGAPTPPLPYLDNSVWFTFTAPKTGSWFVNAIGSDYIPLIATKTPFNFSLCSTLSGPIIAPKGQKVTIMVTDYFGPAGGQGGELKFVVQDHPVKVFGTKLMIDPVAKFDSRGRATVTGTYSCFEPVPDAVTKIVIAVELYQNTGRFRDGVGQITVLSTSPTCDGVVRSWSGNVDGTPFGVKFHGGKADVRVVVETHAPPAATENVVVEAFLDMKGGG